MAGNISLGSTQKAGEGDAFIYDNSGANRNIGILAQQNAQDKTIKAQEQAQKKKQDYDTQKAFYDNLSSINSLGMRTKDLPIVTEGIDDILKYTNDLKMQGKNPLDINNVQEYMQLQGKLGKIQATVDASKTLQKQLTALDKTLATDKTGMFDQLKGYKLLQAGYSSPLADMQGASFELPLAEYNLIPQLDKVTGDNLKTLFASAKVLNDKGAVDDVNKMLGAGKEAYIKTAISLALPAINQGRIKQEKVIDDASNNWDYQAKTTVYNSNKDDDQAFTKVKEDNLVAYRNAMIALKKDMVKVAQRNASSTEKKTAQSETVPINIASIYDRVIAGDGNAVAAFNSAMNLVDGDGAGQIVAVKKGDGTKKFNKTTGQYIVSDPNKTYVITKINGENVWNATDDASKQSFVDGVFGTNLNKQSQIEMNSGKTVKPFAYDTDKQNTVNSKNSSSSSSKDKTSSSSSSTTPAKIIPTISTKAEFDALPKGSSFIRNGKQYKKE